MADVELMAVQYEGDPRWLFTFAEMAEEEGLTAEYDPPMERKDLSELTANVVVFIGQGVAGVVVEKAIENLIKRWRESDLRETATVTKLGPRHRL